MEGVLGVEYHCFIGTRSVPELPSAVPKTYDLVTLSYEKVTGRDGSMGVSCSHTWTKR